MDKLAVVDEYFKMGMWIEGMSSRIRLTGASLKVKPNGYLMVLKGNGAEGPVVTFVGADTLPGVMRKVKSILADDDNEWRADRYAT